MKVAVLLDPAGWHSAIDAARSLPASDRIILLAVDDPADAPHPIGGLLGRAAMRAQPAMAQRQNQAAIEALDRAAKELGRPCETRILTGAAERVVPEAVDGVGMLILVRDGDLSRLGPRSLGRRTRFIIDHAPCRVLLVWPGSPPDSATIPPPPG